MQMYESFRLLPAILLLFAPALPATAHADSSATGITLRDYVGSTARVQDPAGSDWRTVETKGLPRGVPVERYQPSLWVEVRNQGRLIRIKFSNVYLQGERLDGAPAVVCPGKTAQQVAGTQGFAAECAQ